MDVLDSMQGGEEVATRPHHRSGVDSSGASAASPAIGTAASRPARSTRMHAPPLILVCDHRGEGLAEWLTPLDAAGYQLVTTRNLRQSLAQLVQEPPALILVDPLASGGQVELEAIERARPNDPPTPVLVVADSADPLPTVLGAHTLTGGLWDVVHRDAPLEEYLMRLRQLSEMHALRHRAAHDDRTDLLRPHAFEARLSEHFSAAQRHHLELALIVADIDKFKRINDEHDHVVGDRVIEGIGAAIRHNLRNEDVAGRLGGDEFGILLPYTGKLETVRVVQRLLEAIKRLSGRLPEARGPIAVSASIGFETFDGHDLATLGELRGHAEQALHAAKAQGGDCGVYYRSL